MNLDLTEIKDKVSQASKLSDIIIKTNEENARASAVIRGLRGLKQTVKDTFRPHIQTANKLWKDLLASEKEYLEPIERAEQIVEDKIKEFIRVEEQKRVEAQRKIDELAKKEAEKEKAKLEKQAEKLISKGKDDEAEAKLQEAQMVTAIAPIIESKAVKQEGVSTVKVWKFRIVDESVIPRDFLSVDEQKIRKYVTAMKQSGLIAGVQIYCEDEIRVRK